MRSGLTNIQRCPWCGGYLTLTAIKNAFKELEIVLNEDHIDYSKYAELLSELFVIDVFTLNNKLASTDIGEDD